MFSVISVTSGSRTELGLIAIMTVLAFVAIGLRKRARTDETRLVTLFGAYFASIIALLALGHLVSHGAPFVVSPYAISLVVGVLVCWAIAIRRLSSIGLSRRTIFYVLFGCLVFGVIGSRAANVVADLGGATSGEIVERLSVRDAGLGVFGAFAADSLFMVLLFHRIGRPSLAGVLDASASIIALNVAFGRVGCLLAGCCFGAPTRAGIGIPVSDFAPTSPAALAFRDDVTVRLWPTQIIELVVVTLIALICEALYRRRATLRLPDGSVILTAAGVYGAARACLEIVRADSARSVLGVFTVWQVLGVAMSAAAFTWLAIRLRRRSMTRAPDAT